MQRTFREQLIEGLWARLARYARQGTPSQRLFIVQELTHVLSCKVDFSQ